MFDALKMKKNVVHFFMEGGRVQKSFSRIEPPSLLFFYPSSFQFFYSSILLSSYPFNLLSFYTCTFLSFCTLLHFYPSIFLSFISFYNYILPLHSILLFPSLPPTSILIPSIFVIKINSFLSVFISSVLSQKCCICEQTSSKNLDVFIKFLF